VKGEHGVYGANIGVLAIALLLLALCNRPCCVRRMQRARAARAAARAGSQRGAAQNVAHRQRNRNHSQSWHARSVCGPVNTGCGGNQSASRPLALAAVAGDNTHVCISALLSSMIFIVCCLGLSFLRLYSPLVSATGYFTVCCLRFSTVSFVHSVHSSLFAGLRDFS